MPALVETMMFAGSTPWHGLGRQVPGQLPWDEALGAAGLAWGVRLQPVYTRSRPLYADDVDDMAIEGFRAIVRDSDGRALGVASDEYSTISNAEAFRVFERIFGNTAVLETAGSLKGGRTVWGLAEIPGDYRPAGEEHRRYLLITTTHDGSGSLRAFPTAVRVVCNNTLTMALDRSGEAAMLAVVRHRGDTGAALDRAGDVLASALRCFDRYEEQAAKLLAKVLTRTESEAIVSELLGTSKRAKAATADVLERAETGMGQDSIRGTAWALYQGITEHVDHARLPKASAERVATYQALGAGAALKSRALQVLLRDPAPAVGLLDSVLAATA